MSAPLPPDEANRLRTLRLHHAVDEAAARLLEDLTKLATSLCGTPIGLLTFVEENRVRFKARVGIAATEAPREHTFCAHAILSDEMLVVPDAQTDARFAGNPFVVADPHIRFYAGMPLIVGDGSRLGTLCVLDRQPRELTSQQTEALRLLSRAATTHIELLRSLVDFRALESVLPMCGWCRSVRRTDGSWRPLEQYITETTTVSHGICPECSRGMRAQVDQLAGSR